MGLVALAGVGLTYHETGAPIGAWLSLLAAAAVLTVRPQGRWGAVVRVWWWASAIVLACVLAPFVRDQLREALYPQAGWPFPRPGLFERSRGGAAGVAALPETPPTFHGFVATVPAALPPRPALAAPELAPEPKQEEQRPRRAPASLSYAEDSLKQAPPVETKRRAALSNLAQDPHSALQTGPAAPTWYWKEVFLSWSGPVSRDHRMRLVLLSPRVNFFLTLVRLALLLLLVARVLGLRLGALRERLLRAKASGGVAPLLFIAVALTALTGAARAQAAEPQAQQAQSSAPTPTAFGPSKELLEELKERLTRGEACEPACVSTPQLALSIDGDRLALRAEVHADAKGTWAVPGPLGSWLPADVTLDGRAATAIARLDDGFLHVRLSPGVHRIEAVGPLPPQDSLTLQLKDRPHHASARVVGWDVAGIRDDGPPDESIQLSRRLRAGRAAAVAGGHYSSWLEVSRTLEIGVSWRVRSVVRRVSPVGVPVAVRIPLLPGEALTEGEWPTDKGAVALSLNRDQTEARWASTLAPTDTLTLIAPEGQAWSEVWRVECGVVRQCRYDQGLPPVRHQLEGTYQPEFRPWPGEKLTLRFARPAGAAGPTLTIDGAALDLTPGSRLETASLTLATRASREDSLTLTLPQGAEVQEVKVGDSARPVRPVGTKLAITVPTGGQTIQVRWQRAKGMSLRYSAAPVALSLPAANVQTSVKVPEGRFLLLGFGPRWGPAVLFWSYLVFVIVVAWVLGRLPMSPLNSGQWLLLGLGLTQTSIVAALAVVSLPFALAWRAQRPAARAWTFNLSQLALVVWALVALGCLYSAVETGLLLRPEMQVAGNGSTDTDLRWYVDRVEGALPAVSVFTLPLWVYRLAMLAWSLWLAAGLVRGVVWGFRAFAQGGAWRAWSRASKKEASGAIPG
jgi:hypothetical protein